MIELGSLSIKTSEAFDEARRKMFTMAGAFGYDAVHVTKLATVFSELVRTGLRSKSGVHVAFGIEAVKGQSGLNLVFSYGEGVKPNRAAARFFHTFHMDSPDGTHTTVKAFIFLPPQDAVPLTEIIEAQRRSLAQPSREELMRDLQERNEELKASAEEVRASKELTEQVNASLQVRIGELNQARVAMLNILEDLDEAKRGLETAHKQILDSILYASRIQRAVLPGEAVVQSILPQYVVVWEPRDVVGGDLYWCRTWGEGALLILGDCTGHGVPGAFMTLIANGALDQALQKGRPGDPADLIGRMHRLMQTWLGQDTEQGDSDDGIELGACYLPPDRNQIAFAGARFTLFTFDPGGEVLEIPGDKKGIGYRAIPHNVAFTTHWVDVVPGRRFFLTTDGIIDQVGGDKRRGFGKKKFGKLIQSLAHVPLQKHGEYFLAELKNHQGREKRRDDVSIIGFCLDPPEDT